MKDFLKDIYHKFKLFDRQNNGEVSFFFKHWGKSKFMIAMSKKAQYLGIERLFEKGARAFWYFVLFYLIRDVVLYILIPIFFSRLATH